MPPEPITFYASPSANTMKVQAALLECRLSHETVWIDVDGGETRTPSYRAKVPLGQVPAITDPVGPGGRPLTLTESGAVLVYLAEKSGRLMPADPGLRYEVLQWVMWQAAGQGPVFGRLMWLLRGAGRDMTDRRVHEDFIQKGRDLLEKLDAHLEGREVMVGEAYSVADLSLWPWIRVLRNTMRADGELLLAERANVLRWFEACTGRAASEEARALLRASVRARGSG